MNKLDTLKTMTTIVADTGEFEEIKAYKPTDATTNPSLILAAAEQAEYKPLIAEAITWGKKEGKTKEQQIEKALTKAFVNFGIAILKIVPGKVSTEVDARLSFDIEGSVKKARELIGLYEAAGIDRQRVLIKLASTWEGAKAAAVLEKEKIHCNMTLLFSLPQAIICAEAKAILISPFVGRILDWYKKAEGKDFKPEEDPGVKSVSEIYNYYKHYGYPTQIMGASFRNAGEILELAGCDLLTIAPKFLKELSEATGPVPRKLFPDKTKATPKCVLDEKAFRFLLNENAMATEKLAEGIRSFAVAARKLEAQIAQAL